MANKVKYIETKPIPQIIEFQTKEKYQEFIEKRIREILDYTYPNNLNFYEYFKYERILLNKNGTPRKKVENPDRWLRSPKAIKKQKENFAKWCEKRKQMTFEASYRRKKAEIEAKIDFWKRELLQLEKQKI